MLCFIVIQYNNSNTKQEDDNRFLLQNWARTLLDQKQSILSSRQSSQLSFDPNRLFNVEKYNENKLNIED
jgi:hypothetical protein